MMQWWEFLPLRFHHGEHVTGILMALGINGVLGFKFFLNSLEFPRP